MSFAPQAAEKLGESVVSFRLLTAAELRVAAQMLHLRGDIEIGPALTPAVEGLHPICPPLAAEDRPLAREIEAIATDLLDTGMLARLADAALRAAAAPRD